MKKQAYWIKERHNRQTGVYYKACGQLSNSAAKDYESTLYGSNYMLRFETEAEYLAKLNELRKNGECVLLSDSHIGM